ncbi:hypothetical protein, partial [Chryseobacterium gambrini]|uniref:hypothetical protein n=1 Tax=Chryseobacterium gambrini TaxID=373672 RepID=UPI003BA51777
NNLLFYFSCFYPLSLLSFSVAGGCSPAPESQKRVQTCRSISYEIVENIYSIGNFSFSSGTTPSKISSKFSPPLQRRGIF